MLTYLLIFVFFLAIVLMAVAYYFTVQAIKPNCQSVEQQIERSLIKNGLDASLAELPYELWEMKSRRGTRLQARFYPWGNNDRMILLNHGYNAPWISMLKYLPMLRKLGFAVLMPDHQAEGGSEGRWITYGILESEDGEDWLAEIRRRHPQAQQAVMGESMGAVTALLIAERCPELSFCVADCPFNDMEAELRYIGQKRYQMPMGIMMPLVKVWFKILTGRSMSEASPKSRIEKLTIPTLLVHGTDDRTVPVKQSRELAELSEFITYFEAVGASHAAVIVKEPEEYLRRMEELCGVRV